LSNTNEDDIAIHRRQEAEDEVDMFHDFLVGKHDVEMAEVIV